MPDGLKRAPSVHRRTVISNKKLFYIWNKVIMIREF